MSYYLHISNSKSMHLMTTLITALNENLLFLLCADGVPADLLLQGKKSRG
ncbi:hypothetical protein [Pantoea sp. FN0305]